MCEKIIVSTSVEDTSYITPNRVQVVFSITVVSYFYVTCVFLFPLRHGCYVPPTPTQEENMRVIFHIPVFC